MGGAVYCEHYTESAVALLEFKQGVAQLQKGLAVDALEKLSHAASAEPNNAYFLSYYGLALGVAQNKWAQAEALCHQALRIKRNLPQLYLNLAEVYELSGRTADAVDTLTDGLRFTGRDSRIQAALRNYGIRRSPVVPFLRRRNFLNRCLGRVRHTVLREPGEPA